MDEERHRAPLFKRAIRIMNLTKVMDGSCKCPACLS